MSLRSVFFIDFLKYSPASTAGLIALLNRHMREPLASDRHVVVLTGRKV
jgi:hypothetical protein